MDRLAEVAAGLFVFGVFVMGLGMAFGIWMGAISP